jgi:hypothetical protein
MLGCLQCPAGDERPAAKRGLCHRCYHRCRLQVAAGRTTWEALERAGRSLPARPHPRWMAKFKLAKRSM